MAFSIKEKLVAYLLHCIDSYESQVTSDLSCYLTFRFFLSEN